MEGKDLNMIVTGWNNGSPNNSTGARYGIKIDPSDRDKSS